MRTLLVFISLIMLYTLVSCNGESVPATENQSNGSLEEPLIYANKKAMQEEKQQIDGFIRRYKWVMKETGSGLRYDIYYKGRGEQAKYGQVAVLRYSVRLIDGSEIYSSDQSGNKEFVIGRGGVESGLEEGILLMRQGDRAKFIIPSHLGFGLLGDQDKVPPKSTLIYDLELLELK